MLQKRKTYEFPVSEGITTTNLKDSMHDFRDNVPGDILAVEVGGEHHILAKIMAASALEGWTFDGGTLVRLVVLDPPFRTWGAEMRSAHTLGIEALENPNYIHDLGESPAITQQLAITRM